MDLGPDPQQLGFGMPQWDKGYGSMVGLNGMVGSIGGAGVTKQEGQAMEPTLPATYLALQEMDGQTDSHKDSLVQPDKNDSVPPYLGWQPWRNETQDLSLVRVFVAERVHQSRK